MIKITRLHRQVAALMALGVAAVSFPVPALATKITRWIPPFVCYQFPETPWNCGMWGPTFPNVWEIVMTAQNLASSALATTMWTAETAAQLLEDTQAMAHEDVFGILGCDVSQSDADCVTSRHPEDPEWAAGLIVATEVVVDHRVREIYSCPADESTTHCVSRRPSPISMQVTRWIGGVGFVCVQTLPPYVCS